MAERMRASREQLDHVLDPNEHQAPLEPLARAASNVGRGLNVELA